MKKIATLLLLFVFGFVFANNEQTKLFEEAENLYAKGNFEQALQKYYAIEKGNLHSFELYYNMGNCYYKSNQTAKAIQYYSKALKLEPNNEDATKNLKFAFLKTRDKIEPTEEIFLNRWWKSIYNSAKSNTWAWLSLVSFFAFGTFIITFFVSTTVIKRKLFFYSAVFFIVLSATTLLFAWQQYYFENSKNSAVILNNNISIKSAPTDNATNLFILNEGTLVSIIEENENWFRIKLNTEKEGWVSANEIAII